MQESDDIKREYGAALPPSLRLGATGSFGRRASTWSPDTAPQASQSPKDTSTVQHILGHWKAVKSDRHDKKRTVISRWQSHARRPRDLQKENSTGEVTRPDATEDVTSKALALWKPPKEPLVAGGKKATVEDEVERNVTQGDEHASKKAGNVSEHSLDEAKPGAEQKGGSPDKASESILGAESSTGEGEHDFIAQFRSLLKYAGYPVNEIDSMVKPSEAQAADRELEEASERRVAEAWAEVERLKTDIQEVKWQLDKLKARKQEASRMSDLQSAASVNTSEIADVEARIKRLQHEQTMSEQRLFDAKVRAQLGRLEYTEAEIDYILARGKWKQLQGPRSTQPKQPEHVQGRPTYPKSHRDYLDIETLKYYDIPYEIDSTDPNYIIVLREMDQDEVQILFEHTKRLRKDKLQIDEISHAARLLEDDGPLPWQYAMLSWQYAVVKAFKKKQAVHKRAMQKLLPSPVAEVYTALGNATPLRLQGSNNKSNGNNRDGAGDDDSDVRTSSDNSSSSLFTDSISDSDSSISLESENSSDGIEADESNEKTYRYVVIERASGDTKETSKSDRRGGLRVRDLAHGNDARAKPAMRPEPEPDFFAAPEVDEQRPWYSVRPTTSSQAEQHATDSDEAILLGISHDAVKFGSEKKLVGPISSVAKECPASDKPISKARSPLRSVLHSCFAQGSVDDTVPAETQPRFTATIPSSKTPEGTLFSIKHLQQDNLDFEAFRNELLSAPELQGIREQLAEHLTNGWRSEDHSTSSKGHMATSPRPAIVKGIRITPVCIPFLQSHKFGKRLLDRGDLPIMQTLFQSLYPKGHSRRDFKQALWRLSTPSDKRILCVSQLWALLINDELLITCTTLSESELYGGLVVQIPEPTSVTKVTDVASIRVATPDGKLLLLFRADCRTFLDFVSFFANLTDDFNSTFSILHEGHEVLPHQWSRLLDEKDGEMIYLHILRKPPQAAFWVTDLAERMLGLHYDPPDRTTLRRCTDRTPQKKQSRVYTVEERLLRAALSTLVTERSTATPQLSEPHGQDVNPAKVKRVSVSEGTSDHNNAAEQSRVLDGSTFEQHLRDLGNRLLHERRQASEKQRDDDDDGDDGDENITLDYEEMSRTRVREYSPDIEPEEDDLDLNMGDILLQRLDLVYAYIHSGLRATLTVLIPLKDDAAISASISAYRDALLAFITALNDMIFPSTRTWTVHLVWLAYLNMDSLLDTSLRLERHGFTWRQMSHSEISYMLDTLAISLLSTTSVIKDLDLLYRQPLSHGEEASVGDAIHAHIKKMRRLQAGGYRKSREWRSHRDEIVQLERETRIDALEPCTIRSVVQRNKKIRLEARATAGYLGGLYQQKLISKPKKIAEAAAATPADLLTALAQRVTHLPVFAGDHAQTLYLKYMTELETTIWTGEPSREPLESLRYLRYELNAFSQLQSTQQRVLEAFFDCVTPSSAKPDDAGPDWKRSLPDKVFDKGAWLLYSLTEQIRKENSVVHWLAMGIQPLQDECRAQISVQDDWRNNAGVVFTVVTIVFLPLSFVAGVLGMNTTDVRGMGSSQWVYWASAIPLTFLVIVTTLWFVDVPPLRRWWYRVRERKDTTSFRSGFSGS